MRVPKLVLMTGASSGIGYATAKLLSARGFHVLAGYRSAAAHADLKAMLGDAGTPVRLDVTSDEDVDDVARLVEARLDGGTSLAVVSNAGIAVGGPVETLSAEDLREQFEVNVFAPVRLMRRLLPALRHTAGRIICVSSVSGVVAFPLLGAYASSKFALEALCDALRQEVLPFGVAVSLIEPGSVKTPIWDKSTQAFLDRMARFPPEVRAAYAEALAKLVRTVRQESTRGLDPQIVAATILEALTDPRPKARYRVGLDAKVVSVLKRVLPDRVLDRVIARL